MSPLFVLDNSVVMRWLSQESTHDYADKILSLLNGKSQAIVPVLWRYEFISVLLKLQKTGVISSEQAELFVEEINNLDFIVDYEGIDFILNDVRYLAKKHSLTGYDAAYLELAIRKQIPLATLDMDLRKAASFAKIELI